MSEFNFCKSSTLFTFLLFYTKKSLLCIMMNKFEETFPIKVRVCKLKLTPATINTWQEFLLYFRSFVCVLDTHWSNAKFLFFYEFLSGFLCFFGMRVTNLSPSIRECQWIMSFLSEFEEVKDAGWNSKNFEVWKSKFWGEIDT